MISPSLCQKLIITDLNIGNGYTTLQLGEIKLIQNYSKIIHIFNVNDYRTYIDTLETEIKETKDPYLIHQVKHTKTLITALIPKIRNKRGLINIFGTGLKYLYGTMDDNDRIEIEEKLKITTENNHNIIDASNRQISVNTHFDDQLKNLTNLQNEQTKLLIKSYGLVNQTAKTLRQNNLRYELQHIEKAIEQIRELLLASKLRTLTRDILTDQEINDFDITLEKLENIEMDVATKDSKILIIIKIPNLSINKYKKIYIQPIPNKENKQIVIKENEYLVNKNDIFSLTNKEKELVKIKDKCIENIMKKDRMICKFESNTNVIIKEVETNVIIAINVNLEAKHNCNQFPLTLSGHFLIYIENCKIYLNQWYNKKEYQNVIIIPNPIRDMEISNLSDLSLTELQYEHIKNVKFVKELKYSQNVHNYTTYVVITIIIIILSIYFYFKCKSNKNETNISVSLPMTSLKDRQPSTSGGVMTLSKQRLPFA